MFLNGVEISYNKIQAKSACQKSLPQKITAKMNTSSDKLQKQLMFMGAINQHLVSKPDLLSKYLEGDCYFYLNKFSKLLYRDDEPTQVLLLHKPLNFLEGINVLRNEIVDNPGKLLFFNFPDYANAVSKNEKLSKEKIKGIVGQGFYSTAFLTEDRDVIKLSTSPLFCEDKYLVPDVDLPINERYMQKIDVYDVGDPPCVYGTKEPFTENRYARTISNSEYKEIWTDFYSKMKKHNSDYDFIDFPFEDSNYAKQIGFLNDKPYLIDRGCISGRPLINFE